MPNAAQNTLSLARLDPFMNPASARQLSGLIQASQTLAAGAIMAELTATPGTYVPFNNAGADGSQNPMGLLQYAITTDGSGVITNFGGPFVPTYPDKGVPIFYSGVFRTTDISGDLTNALAKLGQLIQGSVADGIIELF